MTEARKNGERAPLERVRDELNRWGRGDMHYGPQDQEQSVVDAVAELDRIIPYITELETRLRGSEVLLAAIVSTVGGYVAVPKKALTGASPNLLRRQDRPELDLTEFRYG